MGAVQLPDHLKRVIDQQVAAGRASSESEFLEQAILRLAEELEAEDDIVAVAEEGIAAVSRGDYVIVASPGDTEALHQRAMARLRASLAAEPE
jgi:Arc/MetJ-type ribon-helix-helix transcriptional regulator